MSKKLATIDNNDGNNNQVIVKEPISFDDKLEIVEQDLNVIQDNLISTEQKLSKHLDTIIKFSEQAQHPKIYESISKIADSISKLNHEATEVLKQKMQLYKSPDQTNIINNTYNDSKTVTNFNGSSSDLLDDVLIKGK